MAVMLTATLGDLVPLTFAVEDGGTLTDASTSRALTVTGEDGTTVQITVVQYAAGLYGADWTPPAAGLWVARMVTTGPGAGADEVLVNVVDPVALQHITTGQLRSYLRGSTADDAELLDVLRAERAAQLKACQITTYDADLREALLRRCARNLAARNVPIATWTSYDGGATSTSVPRNDAEIERLEHHYRWIGIG